MPLDWANMGHEPSPSSSPELRVWRVRDRSPCAEMMSCAVRSQQAKERGESWVTRVLSPVRKVTAFPTQTANASLKVMKIKTSPMAYSLSVKINS